MNLLITLFCISIITSSGLCMFPCKLVWKEYSYGDTIPSRVVEITKSRFIVRIESRSNTESNDSEFIVTDFAVEDVVVRHNGLIQYKLHMLTNPFECTLQWESEPRLESNYQTFLTKGLLARYFRNMTWVPLIFDSSSTGRGDGSLQFLVSSCSGFHVYIFDPSQKHAPTAPSAMDMDFEFLGTDIIDNTSPIELSQTVIHAKRMSQQSYEEDNSLTTDGTIKKIWSDTYPTETTDFTFTSSGTGSKTGTTNSASDEVSTTRTITVTPYTSVEVCSVSVMIERRMTYTAKARFTLPGYTGMEISALFIKQALPHSIKEIEEDALVVTYDGARKDVFALETKLFIFEDIGNCMLIREACQGWRAFKEGLVVPQINEYKSIIERHFHAKF